MNNNRPKTRLCNWILVLLLALLVPAEGQCNQTDPISGCLSCTNSTYLVMNTSSSTKTCSSIVDCLVIDASGLCLSCANGKTLNFTNSTTKCDTFQPGCKLIVGQGCIQCFDTDYFLDELTGQCVLNILEYCWQADATSCLQCSDQNILNKSSCLIPSTYCSDFDYASWQCLSCPNNTYSLHSSGVFCYLPVANCLLYQMGSCIQCQLGYYLSNGSCSEGFTTNLQYQLLPNTYYLTTTTSNTFNTTIFSVCLNRNFYFLNNSCSTVSTNISSCVVANGSICSQCVNHYYVSSAGQCRPCSVYPNCLSCDQYNCKQCSPQYYLAVDLGLNSIFSFYNSTSISATTTSQCLPCTILGCYLCRNLFNDQSINQVVCDECLFGYTLYNYTCYLCPDGTYFNITNKACTSCSVTNCQYCPSNPNCQQCLSGYYYNQTSTTCSSITTLLAAPLLNANTFQVLNKSLPGSSTYIINNQILLINNCADTSNGYTCYCTSTNTTTYSSLCYPININLTSATLDSNSIFGYPNFSLPKVTFLNNLRTVLLLSQLPQFQLNEDFTSSNILMQSSQFAIYLQIKSNYIRYHQSSMSSTVLTMATMTLNNMKNVFSPYQSSILAGPGYYFKFNPANVESDDTSYLTVSTSSNYVAVVLFNQTASSADITGTIYVFTDLSNSNSVSVKIKKINVLAANQAYQVMINNAIQTLSVSSDSDGYLTIAGVPTSTSTTQYAIYVTTTAAISSGDLYSSQRIENIIYRDAFIYILVVIALYLILLPMCALVDCVDNKSFRRRINKEEDSYQGIRNRTETVQNQESSKQQKIFNINYKDFFPIYNIANTQRPKRLVKLCLFIVNLQHSVTFLSLIYFHLNAGQPLVAVLLAIPAYLCCIIMGYICGAITLNLPGNSKYLINLLSLVYWIIWIVVMGSFYSSEYKPYVYTFVAIFFVLDMLFDMLETLLMYFTIKQETRQIRLFRALSRWLSYRGFYQFNEMARDLAQARENQ